MHIVHALRAHSELHGASSDSTRAVLLLAAGRWHRGPHKPRFGGVCWEGHNAHGVTVGSLGAECPLLLEQEWMQ